jgi:hypothetical protein
MTGRQAGHLFVSEGEEETQWLLTSAKAVRAFNAQGLTPTQIRDMRARLDEYDSSYDERKHKLTQLEGMGFSCPDERLAVETSNSTQMEQ